MLPSRLVELQFVIVELCFALRCLCFWEEMVEAALKMYRS